LSIAEFLEDLSLIEKLIENLNGVTEKSLMGQRYTGGKTVLEGTLYIGDAAFRAALSCESCSAEECAGLGRDLSAALRR